MGALVVAAADDVTPLVGGSIVNGSDDRPMLFPPMRLAGMPAANDELASAASIPRSHSDGVMRGGQGMGPAHNKDTQGSPVEGVPDIMPA